MSSAPSIERADARPPVVYLPDFVPHPDLVFRELAMLPWRRVGDTPRMECYYNDTPAPYTYGVGRGRRTYLPEPTWPLVICDIRRRLERECNDLTEDDGAPLDVCFCNMYVDQFDQLGWHADDSPEMDDGRPVVTVSFGATRQIWLRPNAPPLMPATIERLTLEPGSALVMLPGMQDTWQHRVPKHDRPCGPRISLTFRGYASQAQDGAA